MNGYYSPESVDFYLDRYVIGKQILGRDAYSITASRRILGGFCIGKWVKLPKSWKCGVQ